MNKNLFEIKDLCVKYETDNAVTGAKQVISALNGITLDVKKGEILAIAGESGCGKSTLAKAMTLLEKPCNGQILFDGKNILSIRKEEVKEFRKKVQMVFP